MVIFVESHSFQQTVQGEGSVNARRGMKRVCRNMQIANCRMGKQIVRLE